MDSKQQSKVYQFDPNKKKKLRSVNYVDPEKKHMLRERKQAKMDRRNFIIGVALLILAVVALTFFKLKF